MHKVGQLALVGTLLACSCSREVSGTIGVEEQPAETYLVGVHADEFKCSSVFTLVEASELFGGRVKRLEPMFTPPQGVPTPCSYVSVAADREPIHWNFDLDCREGALRDAADLVVSYSKSSNATPLSIGQSALDHHDSALLFIDDDTPCYGRVMGPDKKTRADLARRLALALTPHTAPTGSRFLTSD